MAYHLYTTAGLVLKSAPLGEADKYFYILTEDLGLIIASAKSVRTTSSKLRPALVDYTLGVFSFVRGKRAWKIVGASASLHTLANLGAHPAKKALWARFLGVARSLLQGEDIDPSVFHAVSAFYRALCRREYSATELKALEGAALFKLLHLLGYGQMREEHKPLILDDHFSDDTIIRAVSNGKLLIADINTAFSATQL
jgi:recombinational DNA repair protein (RecF pathway)